MKKILFHFLALVLLWPAWATAQAQTTPFTVLRNNTNIDTNYLYVEVMYERVPCDEHIAQFGVRNIDPNQLQLDTTWPIRIDSILNNEGTYELNGDTTLLMRPKAGGYKLRFKRADFPGDAATSDSILICVKSSRVPFFCKGCAAAGSDALFALEQDIMTGCPYPNTAGDYGDLLACHKRSSKAGNWEAWIRDERDCKPYRIVQMPDSRWWLAQNLNYTKGLTDGVRSDQPGAGIHPGYYWCPGSANFDSIARGKTGGIAGRDTTRISGGDTACNAYGALYQFVTTIQKDGIFPLDTTTSALRTALDTKAKGSTIQGICPKGWVLPGFYDWGVMFNAVEGCSAADTTGGAKSNCRNHINATSGRTVVSKLKATYSSHRDINHGSSYNTDTLTATKTKPNWIWRTRDANNPEYKKRMGYDAQDTYGFSLIAAGYRNYGQGFTYVGRDVDIWTATCVFSGSYAGLYGTNGDKTRMYHFSDEATMGSSNANGDMGYSVRCLRVQ